MELWSKLELDKAEFPQVITIVGSGGKTSLMGQLAKEGKEHNLRVAVLTTTHIRKPPKYQEVFSDMEETEDMSTNIGLESGNITIYGADCGDGKITYPGDECYHKICKHADLILVEADGSRGLPVKYPGKHEPVIPDNVNMILCVCGMSGLGRPGSDVCHRWELVEEQRFLTKKERGLEIVEGKVSKQSYRAECIVKIEADVINSQILAEILEAGYGEPLQRAYPKAKFYYCLNQADTTELQKEAANILNQTGRKGLIISLLGEKNILYNSDNNEEGAGCFLPKEDKDSTEKEFKVAMIYMASGFGRRYGANKLLELVAGKSLYLHGLQTLYEVQRASEVKDKLLLAEDGTTEERCSETRKQAAVSIELVVVSQYEEILQTAKEFGTKAVYNPDSHEGITASIHHGIHAVPDADAYLFAVADQPWLKPESAWKLIREFCTSEKSIACLTDGTRNGNPVIFSKTYKEELLNLTGDRGGSVIMKRYPEEVLKVYVDEKELRDIDVPVH